MDPGSAPEAVRRRGCDLLGGGAVVGVSLPTIVGGLGATGWGLGTTTLRAAAFGGTLAFLSAIRLGSGIAMAQGRRWGLGWTAGLTAVSILLDLGHLAHHTGRYGLPLNAAILYHCVVRLSQAENPKAGDRS